MAVTYKEIAAAVQATPLVHRPVCVHSSLRSFGWVDGGASTVVQGLLNQQCTVMVPTFSWTFAVPPPVDQHPPRNGWDYDNYAGPTGGVGRIYQPTVNEIDEDMGAIPEFVLASPRRRGRHPICSFAATGSHAAALIDHQTPVDVWVPLRALAAMGGYVVLMGVDLTKLTALHLAEKMAGRTCFRRWANNPDGVPTMVEVGGCSDGFSQFDDLLSPLETRITVGTSVWRIFPLQNLLTQAAAAIRANPEITRCTKADCERCRDAVAGGPII